MSEADGQQLPMGWTTATVGDILKVRNGYAFKSSEYRPTGVPLIRQTDLGDNAISILNAKRVDSSFLAELPSFIVRKGDLLIGMSGSLGKISMYQESEPALQNQRTGLLLVEKQSDAAFAKLVMQFVEQQIISGGKGIAVQNVSASQIEDCTFPLPPLREQERISSAAEELFSDLDAGVAALERVQMKLKHYRGAVLKAAVEGALTIDWRAQHPDTEPASELLQHIRRERRRRWEKAQLKKFKASGIEPPKNWKGKYKEPRDPDPTNLPPLPKGWCWATPELLGSVQLGRQRAPQHHHGEFMRPYLRVANVYEDRIDLNSVYEMNFSPKEFKSYELRSGDILLNEGQSLELVGRSAIYRGELPGVCFTNTLVRFRPDNGLKPEFAQTYFKACLRSHRFRKLARWTTNIAHLGADRFAAMEFPLPPLAEQEAIVEAVEGQLSVIDHLDSDLKTKLKSTQALRQSILRHAFKGKLVPQDPNDESASDLLKRIDVERRERTPRTTTAKQTAQMAKSTKAKDKTLRRRAAAKNLDERL